MISLILDVIILLIVDDKKIGQNFKYFRHYNLNDKQVSIILTEKFFDFNCSKEKNSLPDFFRVLEIYNNDFPKETNYNRWLNYIKNIEKLDLK
jgi:hypothetical protein